MKLSRRTLNAAIPFAKTLIARNARLERDVRLLTKTVETQRLELEASSRRVGELEARRRKRRDRELSNILLAVGGSVHVKEQAAPTATIEYTQTNSGRDHHYRLLNSHMNAQTPIKLPG